MRSPATRWQVTVNQIPMGKPHASLVNAAFAAGCLFYSGTWSTGLPRILKPNRTARATRIIAPNGARLTLSAANILLQEPA